MSDDIQPAVTAFLAHRRALGRKYDSEEAELRLLARFAGEQHVCGLAALTPALLEEFLASRPRSRPRSFNHLLGVVRGLLDWAVAQGLLEVSPLQTRPRRVTSTRIPFLFDVALARLLLQAAAAQPDNPRARGRSSTYRAIFALCYGLGLRAGEACRLRLGDIDEQRSLLVVRGGKFGKSRLVPHGPRIAELVAGQASRRREQGPAGPEAPLFTFDGCNSVNPGTASAVFHQLAGKLGLAAPDGVRPPTLHSLRHSFAVGTLLRWYRDGGDPAARLHELSTFMGHVDPVSTAVYLTITSDLLDEASRRFEQFAQPAWTEARR